MSFDFEGVDLDFSRQIESVNVISKFAKPVKAKSQWVAIGYAVFPGYFIPTAFGHAYAEAHVATAAISATRLSGRLMWFHAFFDNLYVQGSRREMDNGQMAMFVAGLAMDIAGYLYDVVMSPVAVASHNVRGMKKPRPMVAPFIDIIDEGPACGLKIRF